MPTKIYSNEVVDYRDFTKDQDGLTALLKRMGFQANHFNVIPIAGSVYESRGISVVRFTSMRMHDTSRVTFFTANSPSEEVINEIIDRIAEYYRKIPHPYRTIECQVLLPFAP